MDNGFKEHCYFPVLNITEERYTVVNETSRELKKD